MTTIQWTDSNGKTYTVDTSPAAQRRNALTLAERIAAAKQQHGARDAGEWAAKVAEQSARIGE